MSNRCPKCNEKLSPLYMKQNCPKCDTNLVYYDLEKRLANDHIQAIKEQEAVDNFLNNIKASAFGGKWQIVRFVLMFSPLIWMCLPFAIPKGNGSSSIFDFSNGITLISIIKDIINGTFAFEGANLMALVTMACVIVFSLAVIISSLFSIGKKALKRNIIFSIINTLVLLGCLILSAEAYLGIGAILTLVTYCITKVLHYLVHLKLNG